MILKKTTSLLALLSICLGGYADIVVTATYTDKEGTEQTVEKEIQDVSAPLRVHFTTNALDLYEGASLNGASAISHQVLVSPDTTRNWTTHSQRRASTWSRYVSCRRAKPLIPHRSASPSARVVWRCPMPSRLMATNITTSTVLNRIA